MTDFPRKYATPNSTEKCCQRKETKNEKEKSTGTWQISDSFESKGFDFHLRPRNQKIIL